jgi:hypothetical protein
MRLRRPTDTLAGCVWLPRFVDKTRHYLAGTLAEDYVRPFCHPLATDGVFLTHFGLTKDDIVAAIRDSAGDDAAVARWFLAQPAHTAEKIAAWNQLAPNIGKDGYPMRRGFLWALRHYYNGIPPDPRVDSVFTAIAYDEGFLDSPAP